MAEGNGRSCNNDTTISIESVESPTNKLTNAFTIRTTRPSSVALLRHLTFDIPLLNRANGLLNRANGFLICANGFLICANGLLNCANGLLNRANGLPNRANGLLISAHGLQH